MFSSYKYSGQWELLILQCDVEVCMVLNSCAPSIFYMSVYEMLYPLYLNYLSNSLPMTLMHQYACHPHMGAKYVNIVQIW
jgi:hypothetical protein